MTRQIEFLVADELDAPGQRLEARDPDDGRDHGPAQRAGGGDAGRRPVKPPACRRRSYTSCRPTSASASACSSSVCSVSAWHRRWSADRSRARLHGRRRSRDGGGGRVRCSMPTTRLHGSIWILACLAACAGRTRWATRPPTASSAYLGHSVGSTIVSSAKNQVQLVQILAAVPAPIVEIRTRAAAPWWSARPRRWATSPDLRRRGLRSTPRTKVVPPSPLTGDQDNVPGFSRARQAGPGLLGPLGSSSCSSVPGHRAARGA